MVELLLLLCCEYMTATVVLDQTRGKDLPLVLRNLLQTSVLEDVEGGQCLERLPRAGDGCEFETVRDEVKSVSGECNARVVSVMLMRTNG